LIHRQQNLPFIILAGRDPCARLDDDSLRRVENQAISVGIAHNLDRFVKRSPAQSLDQQGRHDVKVDIDGGRHAM
jgi:hypothetical protein